MFQTEHNICLSHTANPWFALTVSLSLSTKSVNQDVFITSLLKLEDTKDVLVQLH